MLQRHDKHPSVIAIKEHCKEIERFSLSPVHEHVVEKQLSSLNPKKATGYDKISPKVAKLCSKELSGPLTRIINNSLLQNTFPDDIKKAEVTPVHKKNSHLSVYAGEIIDQSVFCRLSPRSLNSKYLVNYKYILTIF